MTLRNIVNESVLDTHAAIWFITEDDRLPTKAKAQIENPDNPCFVSITSFWEMAIKHSLGKLELRSDLNAVFQLVDSSGLTLLPITTTHILTSSTLPFHHRDPFDRLIIAQAKSEGLTVLTKDMEFSNYDIDLLWD